MCELAKSFHTAAEERDQPPWPEFPPQSPGDGGGAGLSATSPAAALVSSPAMEGLETITKSSAGEEVSLRGRHGKPLRAAMSQSLGCSQSSPQQRLPFRTATITVLPQGHFYHCSG